MSDKDIRKWKKRRWFRDPRCAYCKTLTVLNWAYAPGRRPPANLATVDHLRDRYDETRQEPANGGVRRVLACLSCNSARAAARDASQPIEELWRRSGAVWKLRGAAMGGGE